MTQISTLVDQFITNDPIIQNCLLKNILSLRALARHIISHHSLQEKNTDAIVSAIRRYKRDHKETKKSPTEIFRNMVVRTKDNLADIYVVKNKQTQAKIVEFNKNINVERGDTFHVIQAERNVRITLDDHFSKEFTTLFTDQELRGSASNLCSVMFQFPKKVLETQGIISVLTSMLTAKGVNIIEIMSSAYELIIIVKNEDLVNVLQCISKLKE